MSDFVNDDQARNEQAAVQAAALYGNPLGSPVEALGNIDSKLGAVFDPLKGKAIGERNFTLAQEIGQTRKNLSESMRGLGFSDGGAKELSALFSEYRDTPRDAEVATKNLDQALETLSREWGADFETRFKGAEKVLARLARGNPAVSDFLYSTNLSSDVRLLRLAGNIAAHRKVG